MQRVPNISERFDTSTLLSAGGLDCAFGPELVEGSACTANIRSSLR
jgi:hypothetical protein